MVTIPDSPEMMKASMPWPTEIRMYVGFNTSRNANLVNSIGQLKGRSDEIFGTLKCSKLEPRNGIVFAQTILACQNYTTH
jgi:hypothetical protein